MQGLRVEVAVHTEHGNDEFDAGSMKPYWRKFSFG